MERGILVADLPPADLCPMLLERQPGCDIGFVINVSNDDLRSKAHDLRHAQADHANERSGIHAKCDFVGRGCVQKDGHAFARSLNSGIHLQAVAVLSATLHIAQDQVLLYGVEYGLRNLCARAIVKENKFVADVEGGEAVADPRDGELIHENYCCSLIWR